MSTVHNIITTKFIEALQSGVAPWSMPWRLTGVANVKSKKQYRGINRLLLGMSGETWFLTFNQAKELGGSVKKGAKSKLVCFYKRTEGKKDAATGDNGKPSFILRYYNVFSLADCEGVNFTPPETEKLAFSPVDACELLIDKMRDVIRYGGDSAHFAPDFGFIQMPHIANFKSVALYYKTLFHEIGHALVAKSGDKHGKGFGSDEYAQEELVAEIFASFCLAECGIQGEDLFNHAASYLKGWVKRFQDDSKFIMQAASKAQKRLDWLLGVYQPDADEPTTAQEAQIS